MSCFYTYRYQFFLDLVCLKWYKIFWNILYIAYLPPSCTSPVSWVYRICWLHLCRRVRPPHPLNKCSGYDSKQSGGEALVLEFWEKWSTPSLPLLPGPLWPREVAPNGLIFGSNWTVWHLNCVLTNDLC